MLLHLLLHTKNFSEEESSSVIRRVDCESCKRAYAYRLVRRAEACTSTLWGIGQRATRERARRLARRALERRLARGVDPVPCPFCGWYQEAMVRQLRRERHRWLTIVAWIAVVLGAVVLLLQLGISLRLGSSIRSNDLLITKWIAVVMACAIALPLLLRRLLQQSCNPNAAFPQRPALIPGMPHALDPATLEVLHPSGNHAGSRAAAAPSSMFAPGQATAGAGHAQRWLVVQL